MISNIYRPLKKDKKKFFKNRLIFLGYSIFSHKYCNQEILDDYKYQKVGKFEAVLELCCMAIKSTYICCNNPS